MEKESKRLAGDAPVHARIEYWARSDPTRPAVIFGNQTWSRGRLADLSNHVAASLLATGVDANGGLRLDEDFAAVWDGPPDRRIFVQNAARCSHGIYEPQLSLMAWRSARIVNTLTGREVFDLDCDDLLIQWTSGWGTDGIPSLVAAHGHR